MASLLSMLGVNLPGLTNNLNPFNGLVSGGIPTPPSPVGAVVNPLAAAIRDAFSGTAMGQATEQAPAVRPLPQEFASKGITQDQWDAMNKPDATVSAAKPSTATVSPSSSSDPPNWRAIQAGIFKGESGGNYDTLFGNAQDAGKPFAGTKLTDMTVDQAIAFADPSGPYARWVNSKIGRIATPMGAYQIVGKTLQAVKQGMGLSGNEKMTPALQDEMGKYLLKTGGTSQWEGYKGPAVPGEPGTFHVGSSRSGGGSPKSRQFAADNPQMFVGRDIPNSAAPGFQMAQGDYNTATAAPKPSANKGGFGGSGAPKGGTGPDSGGGGAAHKNSVSPDYKRYQARQSIRHLRNLSPVATIRALSDIGKGLRAESSSNA